MTQGCLFMTFSPISLPALISLFLQLLSAYYASVVLLGMFIFFLFTVCCEYFTAWSSLVFYLIQVSMIFLYITSICWSSEHFPCFELNCRNTSGSLGKQEMLWKQEVVSDCFNNFPCSPKLARVMETQLLVHVPLLAFFGYLSSPMMESTVTLELIIYLCRKSL